MMARNDCGAIPIVDDYGARHLVGIVTDRDIVCRSIALGKDPMDLSARDCMTTSVTTVTPNDSLETCCRKMEHQHVRRIPVVDNSGGCLGIVSQADIARVAPDIQIGEVVHELSLPA